MNITNDKIEKMKDPRKVEQGKRLAAISREAKERKKQERESSSAIEILPEFNESSVYLRLLGLTSVGVVAYLIFKYEPTKYFTSPQPTTESKVVVVKEEKKMNMLESFD